jgi:hypothetical protein
MHNKPHTEEAKAKMRTARLGKPATWKHRQTKEVDGTTLYRCGRCAEFFPAGGFYKDNRTLLGLKSECKKCHSATNIASRDLNNARRINAAYIARARAADPQKFRDRERKASQTRPKDEKVFARNELNKAVKRGDVIKPKMCAACGEEKRLTGHHDDYAKPLDVRWLCYPCHGKEHRHDIAREGVCNT